MSILNGVVTMILGGAGYNGWEHSTPTVGLQISLHSDGRIEGCVIEAPLW